MQNGAARAHFAAIVPQKTGLPEGSLSTDGVVVDARLGFTSECPRWLVQLLLEAAA
jgi:hypothetical protein